MTLDKVPKEKGVVVRDRLIEFHSNVYSANIMCLAILGKGKLVLLLLLFRTCKIVLNVMTGVTFVYGGVECTTTELVFSGL